MEDILEHQPLPPPPPPPQKVKILVPRNPNSEYYRKYSDCGEAKGFAKHLLQKEKVEPLYFIKVVNIVMGQIFDKILFSTQMVDIYY